MRKRGRVQNETLHLKKVRRQDRDERTVCLLAFFHLCLVSVLFSRPSLLERKLSRNFSPSSFWNGDEVRDSIMNPPGISNWITSRYFRYYSCNYLYYYSALSHLSVATCTYTTFTLQRWNSSECSGAFTICIHIQSISFRSVLFITPSTACKSHLQQCMELV